VGESRLVSSMGSGPGDRSGISSRRKLCPGTMKGEHRIGSGLAHLVAVFALLCSTEALAQLKRYSPCDTTIQGVHYNRCKYSWGKVLKSLANVDDQGRLDGGWIEYGVGHFPRTNVFGQYCEGKKDEEWIFRDRKGLFLRSESYVMDVPCGQWWINPREFIELDTNGNVIAVGSGSRDNVRIF
jgi:hypothetical protein